MHEHTIVCMQVFAGLVRALIANIEEELHIE